MSRSRLIRSASTTRPRTATKNGEELRSTDATAGPARLVPSLMPSSVRVVLPNPISAAITHSRRVRGRRLPSSGSASVRRIPPPIARTAAIVIGVVWCSAAPVTGYTTPAVTIATPRITGTGNPDGGVSGTGA